MGGLVFGAVPVTFEKAGEFCSLLQAVIISKKSAQEAVRRAKINK